MAYIYIYIYMCKSQISMGNNTYIPINKTLHSEMTITLILVPPVGGVPWNAIRYQILDPLKNQISDIRSP